MFLLQSFFNLCNGRAFCCYSNNVLWVRGYVFGLNKRLFVAVCLFVLDKNKRQAMLFSLAFCVVGMTGFEPATTRPPDEYSNRAELHPECSWRLATWALSLLRCKDKEKVANYQMSREENQALP